MNINVVSELRLAGVEAGITDNDYISMVCPFHDDHSPTLRVSKKDGHFKCMAANCGAAGLFPQLLAQLTGDKAEAISTRLEMMYGKTKPDVSLKTIEKWHAAIWEKPDLLEQLKIRGIDAAIITHRKLGCSDDGRITIPVMGLTFQWETVRFYSPGAAVGKMKGQKYRQSKPRLYPIDQLSYEEIIIVGGEIKALATAAKSNPYGVGAVSSTNGEGNWHPRLTKLFHRHKKIYIANDIDDAGQAANQIIATNLAAVNEEVYTVRLPFSAKKGGADDYFAAGGTWEELVRCAVKWRGVPKEEEQEIERHVPVTLRKAYAPEYVSAAVEVEAVIAAVDSVPYHIPSRVTVTCMADKEICSVCPVKQTGRDRGFCHTVSKDGAGILALIDTQRLDSELAKEIGIPSKCPGHRTESLSYVRVDEVRLSEHVSLVGGQELATHQPAFIVSDKDEEVCANSSYILRGRMQPHPRSQKAIFVVAEQEPSKDDIAAYRPTAEIIERMRATCAPKEMTVEGVDEAICRRAFHAERHITHIFNRIDMHIACELTYHSPLFLNVNGRTKRGWMETLIIGDSANGKSEVAESYRQYYMMGEKIDCRNASPAGIVGGLQPGEVSKRMFVVWGVLPRNDKGLALFEEFKGLSTESIARLTDTRSSGMAMITKIENKSARARCRILATSNVRSERKMCTYPYGVQTVLELVGAPEDVRRFDLAIAVSDATVKRLPSKTPNPPQMEEDVLRATVMLAWSSTIDGVVVSPEVFAAATDAAVRLCKKYTSMIPLIDPGSTDLKIMKMATAAAAMTASVSNEGTIEVKPVHVEWAEMYIQRVYDSADLSYDKFSEKDKLQSTMQNPEAIMEMLKCAGYPTELVDHLRTTTYVDAQDIQDFGGMTREEAEQVVASFRRCRAITRVNTGRNATYVKTPPFIQFLENLNPEDLKVTM